MKYFFPFKHFLVYTIVAALLLPSFACSYKPAYLQQDKNTEVAERWRVEKINPSRLSPDEKSVYETMGSPQFLRFYRKLSLDRERVYAWVYTEPVRFVTFIDGKKVDYAVLDDDLSPFNEHERKVLFWGGITAGALALVGGLAYYFLLKD
jgi:hypothetical protein